MAKTKLEDRKERGDNQYVSNCYFNHRAKRHHQSNIRIQFQLMRYVAQRLRIMEIVYITKMKQGWRLAIKISILHTCNKMKLAFILFKTKTQYLIDEFNNNQLQYVTKCVDLIYTGAQVFQCSFLRKKINITKKYAVLLRQDRATRFNC